MTLRLAFRSLATRPVRSIVLACGFGLGITAMAGLLGIGDVILEQARSPALVGGGDVGVYMDGDLTSARFVMESIRRDPRFRDRIAVVSPTRSAGVVLLRDDGRAVPVLARGGIPGLERALPDPETAEISAWRDAPGDAVWTDPDPADILRAMDRFHPIPEAEHRGWAEWLYFNGRTDGERFYLSFIAGPQNDDGTRTVGVWFELEEGGRKVSYSDAGDLDAAVLLASAPDMTVGGSRVRLDGLVYRIHLELYRDESGTRIGPQSRPSGGQGEPDLVADLALAAEPLRSMPPFTVRGLGGWVSGYVVPVLAAGVSGTVRTGGRVISMDGGRGYHDHNWGFWDGVTWQWGQVEGGGLSIVFGRIIPPPHVSDPERMPAFLGVMGPAGPLGYSMSVTIDERNREGTDDPEAIAIRARGAGLDLDMTLDVDDLARRRREADDFLQMRGLYRVTGSVDGSPVDLEARGAAETFRPR